MQHACLIKTNIVSVFCSSIGWYFCYDFITVWLRCNFRINLDWFKIVRSNCLLCSGMGITCTVADCRLWRADVSQLCGADVDSCASTHVQCSTSQRRCSSVSRQMSGSTHYHHWTWTSRHFILSFVVWRDNYADICMGISRDSPKF